MTIYSLDDGIDISYNSLIRLEEKLSDMETEDQIMRHKLNSTSRKMSENPSMKGLPVLHQFTPAFSSSFHFLFLFSTLWF